MWLIKWGYDWRNERRLDINLCRKITVGVLVLTLDLFIIHFLVNCADKLILLYKVFADIICLLSELISHQHYDLIIKLLPICVLNFLGKWWLIWCTSRFTHYSLLMLLFVTVDLHNVVYNIEVIIDCVSSREDVLCAWSCIIWLQVIITSSGHLRYISVFSKEIVIKCCWVVIEVLRIIPLRRSFTFTWLLVSSLLIRYIRLLLLQWYINLLFNMFVLMRMWPLDI